MLFTEAFSALGYSVALPRQDWSASNDRGVCLSLWKNEMGFEDGRPWVDTRIHCDPHETWASKHGNRLRIDHLRRAVNEFDGYVDVVIVQGEPAKGYGNAEPWIVDQRQGHRWRIVSFDYSTGHFKAEVVPSTPSRDAER